jgi:hypothetical protein
MRAYFYLGPDDQIQGPITLPLLRNLRATGKISDETFVAPVGSSDWIHYASLSHDDLPPVPEPSTYYKPGKTSTMAKISLALGCFCLLFGCLTGIPAIITGLAALYRISITPWTKGRGFALTGITLGVFSLIITGTLAIFAWPAAHGMMEGVRLNGALADGHQIGLALIAQAEKHDGHFPDNLDTLAKDTAFASGETEKSRILYWKNSRTYRWTLTPGLTTASPPGTVLLESLNTYPHGKTEVTITVTTDGTARWKPSN